MCVFLKYAACILLRERANLTRPTHRLGMFYPYVCKQVSVLQYLLEHTYDYVQHDCHHCVPERKRRYSCILTHVKRWFVFAVFSATYVGYGEENRTYLPSKMLIRQKRCQSFVTVECRRNVHMQVYANTILTHVSCTWYILRVVVSKVITIRIFHLLH